MKTTQIRKRASKADLDMLVRACEEAQSTYLDQLHSFCRTVGDFRTYNAVTGADFQNHSIEARTDVQMPALKTGTHEILLNIPNYTGLSVSDRAAIEETLSALDEEEREPARPAFMISDEKVIEMSERPIRQYLEEAILEQIIKPALISDREEFRKYFTSTVRPYMKSDGETQHLGFQEVISLRADAKAGLQPEIDAYVDELFNAIKEKIPGYERGARVKISYDVDSGSKITLNSAERQYLDDSIMQVFTLAIPPIDDPELSEDDVDDKITAIVRECLENKYIAQNLKMSEHPEYSSLFFIDDEGEVEGLTPEGKELFSEQIDNILENILEDILCMDDIEKGGLVGVWTDVVDHELEHARVEYVVLDPEQEMIIRERTPPIPSKHRYSADDTKEQHRAKFVAQGDIYERAARKQAVDVLAKNMKNHPNFNDYFRLKKLKGNSKAAEDSASGYKQYIFTKKGIQELERTWEKVVDAITDEMIDLKSEDSMPFYLKLGLDGGLDAEGIQEVDVKERKKTIFAYGEKRVPLINVTSKAAPEGLLTDKTLRADASHIVDMVISYVIRPHMKLTAHPDYNRCFIENPKMPGAAWITSEGVEMLEDVINHVSANVAREVLQTRALTPGHLEGMRTATAYKIGLDDRLANIATSATYFDRPNPLAPQKEGRLQFSMPDVTKWLGTFALPESSKQELDKYLHKMAENVILSIVAENMRGVAVVKDGRQYVLRDSHPAYGSFFKPGNAHNPIIMTDLANQAIGRTVSEYSQKVYEQLTKMPGIESGGQYIVQYDFSNTEIKSAKVLKLDVPTDQKGRDILRRAAGQDK